MNVSETLNHGDSLVDYSFSPILPVVFGRLVFRWLSFSATAEVKVSDVSRVNRAKPRAERFESDRMCGVGEHGPCDDDMWSHCPLDRLSLI